MPLFRKNLITVSLLLSVFPGISWADRVDVPVYVEESLGPNWQSMTIGTTSTSTSGMVPPVAHGTRSIAIGNNAVAGTEIEKPQVGEAIAIGSKANATKEQSVAIGADTNATGWGSVVIGGDDIRPVHGKTYGRLTIPNAFLASTASGTGSVAIGSRTLSGGELSLALGSIALAKGDASTAIGATAEAQDELSTAIGFNALSTARSALALGSESSATSESALAFGSRASAGKSSSIALGTDAVVSVGDNNVALGAGSQDKAATSVSSASVRSSDGRLVNYQGFAASDPSSVVSVGAQGKERQIVNVAAGAVTENSTDVINGSQLYSVAKSLQDDINAVTNAGFALKDQGNNEVRQVSGSAIQITGDDNITTTATDSDDSKSLKISLNDDLTVGHDKAGSITVNNAAGNSSISLNGGDGTISLTSPAASGDTSTTATLGVTTGQGGLTDADGATKTRLIYTPDGSSEPEELASMNDGLSFVGDDGNVINKKLNETLSVTGGAGADAEMTDNNIRVDNREGGLWVRMTRNLRDLASAVFGNGDNITTITDNGMSVTTGTGDNVRTVSLGKEGLNNGGNIITQVASGLNGKQLSEADGDTLTNAANIGDLKSALQDTTSALVNSGYGVQADDGNKVTRPLGEHVSIAGDGRNITTSVQDGKLLVQLSEHIDTGKNGSVTVGDTVITDEGLSITGGPSVTKNGINAGGQVISGVQDGVDAHDAVNVSQLNQQINNATAATTWSLKTESSDASVAVSSQTVEVKHGLNTRVSAVQTDDKGNYSYEIDVTGIPVEYTDSKGNPLVNIGGKFYTRTEDPDSGNITLSPAEPARVRISSDQPLVLTNVADGAVTPESVDAVNGGQLASAGNIVAGKNVVWNNGKATLSPDTFSELTTAGGSNRTTTGTVQAVPDNVADAVNMLNREGTKYFKASSSGPAAKAEGRNSVAIGQSAISRAENSIAMGNGAEVSGDAAAGSVAIGSGSRAGRAHTGNYSLNGQAVAGRTGSNTPVMSFGQAGQERQLQHVAPGVLSAESTDAVNGSQLYAVHRQTEGNTQAINNLGKKFDHLNDRVDELNRDIRGVGASAAAMSGIPQAYLPGKSLMGLGVGGYGGESAVAIGVSRISDNGKLIMKMNAGQNSRGNFSVGAGVGWQW